MKNEKKIKEDRPGEKNINANEIKDEREVKNEQDLKEVNESSGKIKEEIDEKDLKIQTLEKEMAEIKDRFLRKVAEFENYKRRTENDHLSLIKYSAGSFILRLLPVMDDFERSLEHIEDAKDIDSIKEGLKLIYGKLQKVFDEEGVKKIDAAGKPFDVNFHEAIMQREDASVEPLTVLDEIEKGYLYKDKVLRHSKVIVSEQPSGEPVEKNENNSNNEK